MLKIFSIASSILFWSLVQPAQATSPVPSLPDIRGNGMDEATRGRSGQALDAAAAKARNGAVRALPNIRVPSSGVDIGQIAARYGQSKGTVDERLIVFATLAMPKEALLRLARQAAQARAVLVFRGVDGGLAGGNWSRAVEAFEPLAKTGASIQIHPDLFKSYHVSVAPTFILSSGSSKDSCVSDRTVCGNTLRSEGDVTLDYVLERWAAGSGELADEARARLALMGRAP